MKGTVNFFLLRKIGDSLPGPRGYLYVNYHGSYFTPFLLGTRMGFHMYKCVSADSHSSCDLVVTRVFLRPMPYHDIMYVIVSSSVYIEGHNGFE